MRLYGVNALRDKLDGDALEEPLGRYLDRAAIYFQGKARQHIQTQKAIDTGRTLNTIGVVEQDETSRTIGPNTTYAPYIEFGRKPGKMPPPGVLLPWMKRHGIEPEAEFGIARAIASRGIAERPFMRPAATETERFMKDDLPNFAAEIESSYARDVT